MWFFGKWITVRNTMRHLYQQHSKTGKRRILRVKQYGGYQPCDIDWIETGTFSVPGNPPTVGSYLKRQILYGD